MEDMLWPEEFDPLEVEECDAPMCTDASAHGVNMGLGGERTLCERHFQKWCREYDQRPSEEEDPPERLSFKVYFAEAVPLP